MAAFHPAIASAESRRNSEFAVIETEEAIVQEDAISPKEEIEVETGNRRYISEQLFAIFVGTGLRNVLPGLILPGSELKASGGSLQSNSKQRSRYNRYLLAVLNEALSI